MAAGIVYHALTSSSGVTFDVAGWVPDTGAPDDNVRPIHAQFDTTGTEIWTAAKITTMLGYLDGVEALLTAIDGRVDGLEALIGTTNSTLAGTLTVGPHAVTNAGTFAVQVSSLPALAAGTNLIGRASASHETSTIYNGTTALTPKFKKIDCSSSGDNEIVAAVSGKKIRVLSWDVSPSDVVNFKWRTASTDITGLYYAANAGNGVSKPYSPVGYFETVADEALNLNLSAAEAVGGSVVYVEV